MGNDIPLLGQNKTQAPKQPEAPEIIEAVTAFVVYLTPDGRVMADVDLNAPITAQRPPTFDDMYGMCANVMKDVTNTDSAMKTAQATINGQLQVQAQMQQAQQNAQIQQALAEAAKKNPGGTR